MSKTKTWDRITLEDLLRVDSFDQQVYIYDPIGKKNLPLVQDNREFFTQIYANVTNNQLQIIDGSRRTVRNIDLDKWINEIANTENSVVVFIEGYAGCGKSTFVQYLLSKQLGTYNYDYSYYNYDIGSYYHNKNSNRLLGAIRECFIQQLIKCVLENNTNVIMRFRELLSQYEIRYLDTSQDIYNEFINTITFSDALDLLIKHRNEDKFRSALYILLKPFSCEQVLALDYVFRLARYIESNHNNSLLYICYDNMDSIENSDQLNIFDNTLVSFRKNLDDYINTTQNNYSGFPLPRFVILTTYRKITATKVELSVHSERGDDFPEYNQYIYHIEASHLYSFHDIIKKRQEYFSVYIDRRKLSGDELKDKLSSSIKLTKMDFVYNKYAGLWNNNYRTCSNILNRIFTNYMDITKQCIDFDVDGYDDTSCTYYGASAVFLGIVCKIFHSGGLWGKDHLNLIPLNQKQKDKSISELTSLSRLILTYMSNITDSYGKQRAVSTAEIFDEFADLFPHDEICGCLSNMLARDKTDTWRRPIYYYRNAINDDINIADALMDQLNAYLKTDKSNTTSYTELMLCECGYAYIERLMSDFEFFSNRISNDYDSIYIISDLDKIKTIIDGVYTAVKNCCLDMLAFSKVYMQKKKIESYEEYSRLAIHPRTHNGNPQLHTERIIFSHIAYLDQCRLYHINLVTDYELKKQINSLFVDYISLYLSLYQEYILPINSDRRKLASKLKSIVCNISHTKDFDTMFQSISDNDNSTRTDRF